MDVQGVPLGNFLGFNHQLLATRVDHGPTHLLFPFLVTIATKNSKNAAQKQGVWQLQPHLCASADVEPDSKHPVKWSRRDFPFLGDFGTQKSDVQFGAKAPRYTI